MKQFLYFTLLFVVLLFSCTEGQISKPTPILDLSASIRGSGIYVFNYSNTSINISINVYFHIPNSVNFNTEILMVLHGNGRNAGDYRDAFVAKADLKNFIVVVPEFSSANFPGGHAYNLGHINQDGDNTSTSNLNPEDKWTFSIIEPLFEDFKRAINSNRNSYHIFGHSAGGQFAHRFVFFKPNALFDKVIASASSCYTVPNESISLPYGLNNSPLTNLALSTVFQKVIIVQIGTLDTHPNAPGLRRNVYADAQGTNRFDRPNYFYNTALNLANTTNSAFNWQLQTISSLDHDFQDAAFYGADIIFN